MNVEFWSLFMASIIRTLPARLLAALPVFLLGLFLLGGCAKEQAPEPTKTKEERRQQEKQMMHREMRNE